MLEQIWFSLKVLTRQINLKSLLNSLKITKKAYIYLPIWLNLEKPHISIFKPSKNMVITVLFTQYLPSELLWKQLMISLAIWKRTEAKKNLWEECKAENNFTICFDTLLEKSGIIPKMNAKNDHSFFRFISILKKLLNKNFLLLLILFLQRNRIFPINCPMIRTQILLNTFVF